MKRPQPHPPHEVPFIAGRSHFTRKNARNNIHAAITMRFLASRGKTACIYAHGNTRCQQSCSHPNAICNHRFMKRIALHTHEQPHDAEHQGRTDSTMKRPQPHPPHEVPFTAGRSHFTRKNARFRAPASSPTQAPCNIHAAITMRFGAPP